MFVKLLQGPRAGEIVEMKFMDAQPLLSDGRAQKVCYDGRAGEQVTSVAEPAAPAVAPAKKKKR
jgi:hypothetical protein